MRCIFPTLDKPLERVFRWYTQHLLVDYYIVSTSKSCWAWIKGAGNYVRAAPKYNHVMSSRGSNVLKQVKKGAEKVRRCELTFTAVAFLGKR